MEHEFTQVIIQILQDYFGEEGNAIFERSPLLQYLNIKTQSVSKGSKSRSNFANLYAVYVLIEDYLKNNFDKRGNYNQYEGAKYTDLFDRQRELPFGSKLQNHALINRMNDEFKKYFPQVEFTPILRDVTTNRYWINENLLKIKDVHKSISIAQAIIEIINQYILAKQSAFKTFIETCKRLQAISSENDVSVIEFIAELLSPNSDARIFEIVSYAILRYYYHDQFVYFGYSIDSIQEENLTLYKTGRTNANDGGIDFVMRPLGRFFQVTETLNVKKIFP